MCGAPYISTVIESEILDDDSLLTVEKFEILDGDWLFLTLCARETCAHPSLEFRTSGFAVAFLSSLSKDN